VPRADESITTPATGRRRRSDPPAGSLFA
jgi:hypothetical protein